MKKTSVSAKKKKRDPPRPESNANFLPGPGEGSDHPGADFVIQCVVVCLQTAYAIVACVARPLWALVRFVCWEAWQKPPAGGKPNG